MDNWSNQEKCQFNEDWANNDFLCWDDEARQPNSPADEPLENQVGEGSKRNHASNAESPSKRHKSEEYFMVKSVKHINVRKFKPTGTDYAGISSLQWSALCSPTITSP